MRFRRTHPVPCVHTLWCPSDRAFNPRKPRWARQVFSAKSQGLVRLVFKRMRLSLSPCLGGKKTSGACAGFGSPPRPSRQCAKGAWKAFPGMANDDTRPRLRLRDVPLRASFWASHGFFLWEHRALNSLGIGRVGGNFLFLVFFFFFFGRHA